MTRDAYRATKAAAKVKAAANLARAALIAEDRRIARGGRRYSEATDPVKQMIRADVAARAAKRAGRSAALAMVAPEPEPMDAEQQDHLKLLEALRDKHRREAGET
jgi:hypothetical protein